MKKSSLVIFLSILIILGCSDDDDPGLRMKNFDIVSFVTLDENSEAFPSPLSDDVFYRVSTAFSIPELYRIKKLTIHTLTVNVSEYTCNPPEMLGVLETRTPSSIDAMHIPLRKNYYTEASESLLKAMEKDLKTNWVSDLSLEASVSPENTPFKVQLGFYMQVTVWYFDYD